MYVETIFCENMGPIERAVIKAGFTPDGNPKPIVLVGKNGSGKSIMLSNVVDALHELGDQAFGDITKKDHNGHKYLKIASRTQIRIGNQSLCGFVSFRDYVKEQTKKFEYLYTWGTITNDDVRRSLTGIGLPPPIISADVASGKEVTKDKESVKRAFKSSVISYFPAYRYATPDWMGEDYTFATQGEYGRQHFSNMLNRRIIVDSARVDTLNWIQDILSASKPDLIQMGNRWSWTPYNDMVGIYQQTRRNIELILSRILGEDVAVASGVRSSNNSPIDIYRKGTKNRITPSFYSLSTGQAILADIFLTILRYADAINSYVGSGCSNITGLVIIDEIDAHLHTDLQYRVLPKVMKLFPKVQFIVTAHAPLFVLGMDKEYGEDGFDVYEMPECNKISAENYREFQKAFEWVQDSKTARERERQITEDAIQSVRSQASTAQSDEILVVTEGCTDWKHMKHAWSKLESEYPELQGKLRFWEYHPKGKGNGAPEFDMGDSQLIDMCKQVMKIRQHHKIVFVADADKPDVTKELRVEGAQYKKWGNNVYSFQLPNSELRENFSAVCIEHYYTDDALKTEIAIAGVKRRLFLSNEFFKQTGQTKDHQYFYENIKRLKKCGEYDIIEGDKNNRVIKALDESENPVNYALPKNDFASEMLSGNPALANVRVEVFKKIFDVLKQIATEPLQTA